MITKLTHTELSKHTPTKPHYKPKYPYEYSFGAIDVYTVNWGQYLEIAAELRETHHWDHIDVGKDNPHHSRILWEIATHIEGYFGPPYEAIIVCRGALISIHTPKEDRWWNPECWSDLSNYIMGLRSLLDLLPKEIK